MNRKQRRDQNKTSKSKEKEDIDVQLAQPPADSKRNAKTLYEIAAERQAALGLDKASSIDLSGGSDNVVNVAVGPDGEIRTLDGKSLPGQPVVDEVNPLLDTLLFAVSLSALHFTLEALTVHQYADELIWTKVFQHTAFPTFPILFLLIHFMHGHLVHLNTSQKVSDAIGGLKQLLFVAIANVAGCYLIHLTNDKGYMAVMKNAPSIGTVWVWSVIELGLLGALAGVAGPCAYAWWYGYGIV